MEFLILQEEFYKNAFDNMLYGNTKVVKFVTEFKILKPPQLVLFVQFRIIISKLKNTNWKYEN